MCGALAQLTMRLPFEIALQSYVWTAQSFCVVEKIC